MSDSNSGKKYEFFVDAKRYESAKATLTGAEIKQLANVPAANQLFLEADGDAPDIAISDGEGVNLDDRGGHGGGGHGGGGHGDPKKHFYAVPPATFGAA